MRRRNFLRTCVVGSTLPLLGAVWVNASVPAPPNVIPAQYIAKMYTEALGRIPDITGWQSGLAFFQANGCTVATLNQYGKRIFRSPEYSSKGYGNGRKVLTIYRAVLNREPDPSGYVHFRDTLNHVPIATLLDRIYASAEFSSLAKRICSPDKPDYDFGTHPAIQITASGPATTPESGSVLQVILDTTSASGGGVVEIPQSKVYRLSATLRIPGNVTLRTVGGPGPANYATQARLVRSRTWNYADPYGGQPLVELDPGGKLTHLWVDGQRGTSSVRARAQYNVRMLGGTGTTVQYSRLGNPVGATNVEVVEWTPCFANVVSDNLIEGYSSHHGIDTRATDGVSVHCKSTTVDRNQFVDVTDGAVIVFHTGGEAVQASKVRSNRMLNAGQAASWGFAADAFFDSVGDAPTAASRDFTGTEFNDNVLWTSNRTHIDILLGAGTHALFGSQAKFRLGPNGEPLKGRNGKNVSFSGNNSAGQRTRTQMAFHVSGMRNARLVNNRFRGIVREGGGACPKVVENAVITRYGSVTRDTLMAFWNDSGLASDRCMNSF